MNLHNAVYKLLKQEGKPLHVKEIAERIISAELWEASTKTPEASVSSRLHTHIKYNGESSPFIKTAPNTFALRQEDEDEPILKADSLSFLDAAEKVLEQLAKKKAMHYREITRLAIDHGWLKTNGKTPEQTMNAQLVKHINNCKNNDETALFMRESRARYGLVAWLGKGLSQKISKQNLDVKKKLLEHVKQMSPKAVEDLVGHLLAEMGFEEVEVTKYNGDNGIDVKGILLVDNAIRIKMKVQVKRWQNNVQAPEVQKLRGTLGIHDQGLLITTSDFSRGAREEANRPECTPIALMNGEHLASLLMKFEIGVHHTQTSLYELDTESLDAI
jgi:restriction system protein